MASDPHLATRQLQPAGSPGDDRPRVRPDGREGQSRCGCSPLKCSPDGSRSFAEPRWAEVRQAHAHGYILAGAESREPLTSSSPFRATWEKPFFSLRLFPLSAKSRANFLSCRTTRDPFYTHGLPSSYLTQRERGRQELSGQAAGWPVLALSSVSPTPAAQLGAQLHPFDRPLHGQVVTRTPGGERQALSLLSLPRQAPPAPPPGHPHPGTCSHLSPGGGQIQSSQAPAPEQPRRVRAEPDLESWGPPHGHMNQSLRSFFDYFFFL